MTAASAAVLVLRLRLAGVGPVACGATLVCALALAALAWLLPQRAMQSARHALALKQASAPAPGEAPPRSAQDNLALFYGALGEQRHAEQQVNAIFRLAAQAGLTPSQGEYTRGYDEAAMLHTYQVSLPVKGNYRAIWQFGLLALDAVPFASLDGISFKRESIGDPGVEARLRLTFYLDGRPPGARPRSP